MAGYAVRLPGVGDKGVVLGVDVTAAMLDAAARHGRDELAALLLADACHLPLTSGSVDGIFSAGLINHLPEPAPALGERAQVTAPAPRLSAAELRRTPSRGGRFDRARTRRRTAAVDAPVRSGIRSGRPAPGQVRDALGPLPAAGAHARRRGPDVRPVPDHPVGTRTPSAPVIINCSPNSLTAAGSWAFPESRTRP
ncbi:methyltransferase domain-containing protein [Streptomyces sp. NPDC090798]|uniref:methyltransferase domain-containing protein n=1 Tax=Streptomyces sp. NPDC090798 TaxID=3365968 RepID=UPI00382B34A3